MRKLALLALVALFFPSMALTTYTVSKTPLGTVYSITHTTETKKCAIDYLLESKKILSYECFNF